MLPKETLLKDLKIKLAINRILYPVFSALFVAIGIWGLIKFPGNTIWPIPVVMGVVCFVMQLFANRRLKKVIADMENEQNANKSTQTTENE